MPETKSTEDIQWLSQLEVKQLALMMLLSKPDEGVTQEEIQACMDWAKEVREGQAMLELVLSGRMKIAVKHNPELDKLDVFYTDPSPEWAQNAWIQLADLAADMAGKSTE